MSNNKTVNIIGSGLGGLVSGAVLASHGVKVRIFERLSMVGGLTVTFKRKGYKFEGTTHQICGFGLPYYFPAFLKEIGITDLETIKLDSLYTSNLVENGSIKESLTLPAGKAPLYKFLTSEFPDHTSEIKRFIDIISGIGKDIMRIKHVQNARSKLPILFDAITALMLKNGKEGSLVRKIGMWSYPDLVKYFKKSYGEIFDFLPSSMTRHLFNYCLFSGLPPSTLSGSLASVIFYLYGFHSPYFIKGGIGQLIGRLSKIITSHGGEILLNTEVTKIRVENGKTTGVETLDGGFHSSDCVVSGISTRKTILDLMSGSDLPAEYVENQRKLSLAASAFQVYVGIPEDLADYGLKSETIFYNYSPDIDKNLLLSMRNGVNDNTTLMYTNYTHMDPSYTPEGKNSFVLIELDNYGRWENLSGEAYEKQKLLTQDVILDKFEAVTGIKVREKADIIFSASPLTFKHYMNNECGEIYGTEQIVSQAMTNRTAHETPIDNLMLVGHYTQTGSGVSVVIDGAGSTARSILKLL